MEQLTELNEVTAEETVQIPWVSSQGVTSTATNPDSDGTKPDAGTTKPNSGTTTPDSGTTNPDSGTTNPDSGTTKPDSGTTTPDSGTTNPDSGTTNPDSGTTNPDSGTTNPDSGTTNPDSGTTNPDSGTTNPDSGTTNPDSGTTNPDSGTTNPEPKPDSKPNYGNDDDNEGSHDNILYNSEDEAAAAMEAEIPAVEEGAIYITHDHDEDSETAFVAAPENIYLEKIRVNDTYELDCEGDGSESVVWGTDNEQVASVDQYSGTVTFTGIDGTVRISATALDGRTDYVVFHTGMAAPAETVAKTLAVDPTPTPEPEPKSLDPLFILSWVLVGILAVLVVILLATRGKKNKRAKGEYSSTQQNPAHMPQTQRAQNRSTLAASEPVPAPVAAPLGSGVRVAAYQEIGARKDQQDSYRVTDPGSFGSFGVLAVVADGMGGLANGKAVSSTLANTFCQDYPALAASNYRSQDILLQLATNANQRINQMLVGAERSGSTLISTIIKNNMLYFLTAGDSRLYLYRAGALLQLNREHIYQEELAVKAVNGQVPMSQVSGDRQAHALTSFFGSGNMSHLDRNYEGIRLLPGDRIVLCSDGVFGTLPHGRMEQALTYKDIGDAVNEIKRLVLEANKPHQDNNTCVILEYLGE